MKISSSKSYNLIINDNLIIMRSNKKNHLLTNKFKKYHFDDFTESHYNLLLKTANKNYKFENFGTKSKDPHIILRHDVDISVHRALALAKIEKKNKIHSTYFFRLRREFYNIFEKSILSKIHDIIKLGHSVGLHFDLSFYENKSKKNLIKNLNWEKKVLSELLDEEISIFSFHNPDTKHALSILDYRLSEMINVYSKKIRNSYYYISDSNGYWRYSRLFDLLKNNTEKNIQILIHPEWWQKTAMSPRMRVVRGVDERSKRTLETYDAILKASKRKNIK